MTSRFHNPHSTSSVSDPDSPHYDPSSPNYDSTRDSSSPTYIDRNSTSNTGAETEQNAEAEVTAETENGSWLDQLIAMFTHGSRVDETYRQDMTQQAEELARGLDTRPGPMMMCSNYLSIPHGDLKKMVTEDVNPDGVGETGDLWIEAGNAMTRFQNGVAAAINNSETDWQGPGGDSARTFMASVGNWVGTAGQSAQLAGTQTNLQASSLAEAKRTMPEPVDFDVAAANRDLSQTTDPSELISKLNTYQQQYDDQQAAHEQAATVVNTYDSSLATSSTMPAFGPPPTMASSGDTLTQVNKEQVGTTGVNDGGPNGTTSTTGTNYNGTGNPQVSTPPPGNNQNGPGGDPNLPGPGGPGGPGWPNDPNQPGDGNNTTDPSNNTPTVPGPGPFPTPGPSGNPNHPGSNNPMVPPMPVGGMPPGGGGDYGRSGGPGGGRFGGGPGGMGGPGSGSGAGGLGRGGGPGGFGPGGALAAENAAMRGAAGVRGGMGGMMPMGAGNRGQSEDDDEHNRPSFLVEADPDEVFGTDEATAPPVIGG